MITKTLTPLFLALAVVMGGLTMGTAQADNFTVTVDGPDAIFLAGRTDVVIPAANLPWNGPGTHLIRHGGPTPEEALESLPPFIPVTGGDVIRVLNPAVGGGELFQWIRPSVFRP